MQIVPKTKASQSNLRKTTEASWIGMTPKMVKQRTESRTTKKADSQVPEAYVPTMAPIGRLLWGFLQLNDAREWISEIPTVHIYYLAKPPPMKRVWQNQQRKKTLLSEAGLTQYTYDDHVGDSSKSLVSTPVTPQPEPYYTHSGRRVTFPSRLNLLNSLHSILTWQAAQEINFLEASKIFAQGLVIFFNIISRLRRFFHHEEPGEIRLLSMQLGPPQECDISTVAIVDVDSVRRACNSRVTSTQIQSTLNAVNPSIRLYNGSQALHIVAFSDD
nr:hypothetical protein HmN_000599900 [Hymenolepis microstoma]